MNAAITIGYFAAVILLIMSYFMARNKQELQEEYDDDETTAIRRDTISKTLNGMKRGPTVFLLVGLALAIASTAAVAIRSL